MPFVSIPWTGYSPTMGANGANVPSLSGSLQNGESFQADKVSRMLRRPQFRGVRKLWLVLTGAAAGSNATENYGREKAYQAIPDYAKLGGLVEIESTPRVGSTIAGRNTTAADETRIENMINRVVKPSSYPTEASGNSGGGKKGF